MTATQLFVTTATATVLALTLSACSDESNSSNDPSSSSSGSTSSVTTPPEPKDRSSQVFDSFDDTTEVLGSSSGEITIGIGGVTTGEVTFEVTGVTATADSTVLHYQLVADEKISFVSRGAFWDEQPSLRIPGDDVRMQTVTAKLPNHDGEPAMCACTSVREVLPEPQPQEVVYPPLPEDVEEIEVILEDLDPVTVPVSR